MSALTKSLYLARKKPKLDQQVSFLTGFNRARKILLRLAEKSPYTLFSLYTAAAIKKDKKSREITAIVPPQTQMLIDPFKKLFDEIITVDSTPSYGSKPFKALKEQMERSKFDVFCDLDTRPLPEIAVLSQANLRMAYYNENLYPFFNILFRQSGKEDLLERSVLITRLLTKEERIEQSMPKPKINQAQATEWLKRHGLLKDNSYLLTSLSLEAASETASIRGMRVFPATMWESESTDMKAALFTSATFYVGALDRGFELSYLMGTPSILVIPEKVKEPLLPSSPFVKSIIRASQPSLATIEQALTGSLP